MDDDRRSEGLADAVRIAQTALVKIEGHMETCERRYDEQSKVQAKNEHTLEKLSDTMSGSLGRIHERIDKVLWSVGAALIVYLLSVLGYVLINGTPWHNGG